MRVDSTVVEADVRYPTDSGLAADGVRALAREGKRLAGRSAAPRARSGTARARSRGGCGRCRPRARRSGERKQEVLRLTAVVGRLLEASLRKARGLTESGAPQRARPRGARQAASGTSTRRAGRALRAGRGPDPSAAAGRADQRPGSSRSPIPTAPDPQGQAGQADRIRLRRPDRRGHARHQAGRPGLVLPATSRPGNPGENQLLPDTVSELERLGLSPSEVALDGGFQTGPTTEALQPLTPKRTFIAGRRQPGSKRTRRRLARYRTGSEGRISHLKRRYGLRRSRLKGQHAQQTWTAGRSSPTTLTRSPSAAPETLQPLHSRATHPPARA